MAPCIGELRSDRVLIQSFCIVKAIGPGLAKLNITSLLKLQQPLKNPLQNGLIPNINITVSKK
jgi:hypothetical protein